MRWSRTICIPCLSLSPRIPLTPLLLIFFTSFTQAAPYTPTPYFYCHSNYVAKKALYVHGGKQSTEGNSTDQTFSLDLSQSWNTSSPIFSPLVGRYPSQGTTSTLVNSNSTWLMIFQRNVYTYTFATSQWSEGVIDVNLNMAPNMPMVTDPGQNQVYIINGFYNYTNTVDRVVGAMRYDPSSQKMSPMLASTRLDLSGGYAVVWSSYRNFVLAFGGFVRGTTLAPSTYSQTLFQFNPQHPQFLPYETTNVPSARYAHCMVEAYGGSQIILYGGADDNEGAMSDLHILDVESKTWTLQKVDSPPVGRAYPCCAVTNDMFVAWSGARWDKASKQFRVLTDNITIVFNIKTKQWQDSFSPEPYVIPTQTTSATSVISPTTTTTVPRELSAGSIAGAVIGGLALLLAIAGGVFWFRMRKDRNKTWIWSTIWNRRNRSPSMEKRNLTKTTARPAGSSITDDTLWSSRSSHGGDDYDDEDYHGGAGYKHDSIMSDKSGISGYGFRIGKHNFVQLESANSSETGPIFQMVTIHNPTDIRLREGEQEQDQDQDQDQNEPLMSPTTVRLIPISSTSPVNSASVPSASIMSIASAFTSSSASGQPQTTTGSSLTVVSSELDEQWATAAVALAKEGQTRVERGERRNPHGPIQKIGYIDTLDLREFESMPLPARNPHVFLEE